MSHSSKDDEIAEQLEACLAEWGFDDCFIDHSDIRGGDKWTDALRRAKGACRVVLCLITSNWLASDECFGEFTAAWYQGKRIIPLLALTESVLNDVQARRLSRVMSEDQGFNLTGAINNNNLDANRLRAISEPLQAGLRAGGALAKIGFDPQAFEIDCRLQPSPYPGLQSFDDDDADAAIFFGRSPEIARCLEDLREMRANGLHQPYAILGASGSGKSSLMKAGLLPRLRRELNWIVVRAFRPGTDPLFNFCDALARTLGDLGECIASGSIRDTLRDVWLRATKTNGFVNPEALGVLRTALQGYLALIRGRSGKQNATILISIDQAEELVRQVGESGDALCDYFRAATTESRTEAGKQSASGGTAIIFTIRSDSFAELQQSSRFFGLDARCADIRPVPIHRFAEVVEGPALRYGIQIDTGLVEAMIEDLKGEHALPLLAFMLERLWKQYRAEGRLRRSSYESVGKISGLIEDAAERALRGIKPGEDCPLIPKISGETDRFAASIFVPPLAQVNENGTMIRRVAPIERFNATALELLEYFVSWRLLIRKKSFDGTSSTIELAHESIFAAWPRLQRWIEPEKIRLQTLLDLQGSAYLWDRHRRTPFYIDHRGARLKQALELLTHEDFSREISDTSRCYLDAAVVTEQRRRALRIIVSISILLMGVCAFGAIDNIMMRKAMHEAARLHVRNGKPLVGAVYAVAGSSGSQDLARLVASPNADRAIWETGIPLKVLVDIRDEFPITRYGLSGDGRRMVGTSADEAGGIWNVDTGEKLVDFGGNGTAADFLLSEDGLRLIVRSTDNSLTLWDVSTGRKIAESGAGSYKKALMDIKTSRLATLSESGTCVLWDLRSGTKIGVVGAPNEISDFLLSKDESRILAVSRRGVGEIWDTASGRKVRNLGGPGSCQRCSFAPKGSTVFSLSSAGDGVLFHGREARFHAAIKDTSPILGWSFAHDGQRLITRSIYDRLVLWDTLIGTKIKDMGVSDSKNWKVSPSGLSFLVRSSNGSGKLYNAQSGAELTIFGPGELKDSSFSSKGERLATIGLDKSSSLWDAVTGRRLVKLAEPGVVDSIRFSDDGTRLSVGSLSSQGALWDAESGHKLSDYIQISTDYDGQFSKNGKIYASSSSNSTAAIWDTQTGSFLTEVVGSGSGWDVRLSDDGQRIAIQTGTNHAMVFDISDIPQNIQGSSLKERACRLNRAVIGNFSVEIRNGMFSRYLRGRPWNPCDWHGLTSLNGWKQELRYWAVKIGLPWDYQGDEIPIPSEDR